jgi:NADH-quinone oxidoreductase subunit C
LAIDPWIEVKPAGLVDVCQFLRQQPELAFDMLNCITAVDYFEPDEKKAAQVDWQPHMEVLYHLSSLAARHRIVLKVSLPRWLHDQPGQLPELASVSDVWRTAEWHEREVFDLSGVRFIGNRDLRRILCPEDWPGHPLRKDFVMPSEYHGIPTR